MAPLFVAKIIFIANNYFLGLINKNTCCEIMDHKQQRLDRETWVGSQVDYWDGLADQYDSLYQTMWSQAENNLVRNRLANLLKENTRVLDLACGTGLGYGLSSSIVDSLSYVGLDISPQMLNRAREKWCISNAVTSPRFFEGEMSNLSMFESHSFDFVISLFMSFSYTYDIERSIQEIKRVLVPGGFVFLSALNRWSLRRLVRLKFGQYEFYKTRNYEGSACSPTRLLSQRKYQQYFKNANFQEIIIEGYDFFGGIIEASAIWKLNLILSAKIPFLCHSLVLIAQKP